jgi:putative ABC transport system substrate-binding protein
MRRRAFITLIGGAAAWPLAARAQQGERMRRIGILQAAAADDAEFQARVGAFLQALALSGWTIGRNLRIDTRWAGGKADDIRRHGAELVALAPDVILTSGAAAVGALLQVTRTVPRSLPIAVPVGAGRRQSARPGGRPGFMTTEYSISGNGWSCSQIALGVTRAVLRDPQYPPGPARGAIQVVAPSL